MLKKRKESEGERRTGVVYTVDPWLGASVTLGKRAAVAIRESQSIAVA